MLCLWEIVLRQLHGVSKLLHQHDIDLQKTQDRMVDAYVSIQLIQTEYNTSVKNAKKLEIKWGIPKTEILLVKEHQNNFFMKQMVTED